MPAGRAQDSSLFYAVVIFVVLFLISTTFAVVFYVKFSDLQKSVQDAEKKVAELATTKDIKNVGTLVGTKEQRTVLGTMLNRFDALAGLVLGTVPSDSSAQATLDTAQNQAKTILSQIQVGGDSNSVGLIPALVSLKGQYDAMQTQLGETTKKLADLTQLADEEKKAGLEKEKETGAYVAKLKEDSDRATKGYEDLKATMQKNAEGQVADMVAKVSQAEQDLKKEQQERLAAEAKLKNEDERVTVLQAQVDSIVPKPDNTSAAFKPDGKIISIDNSAKTVIINLGNDDHVYRGLTFSIYDKGLPIPRSGKGKATIEVFDVQKKVSAARITSADKGNPIMEDDIIANLIWDAKTPREFVVTGIFNFGDGAATIKDMIEKWGGSVADKVSIRTSFVVLGNAPSVGQKPTSEQIDADPKANEKFESQNKAGKEYMAIQEQAKALSVPVFNVERFLDFVGYSANAR